MSLIILRDLCFRMWESQSYRWWIKIFSGTNETAFCVDVFPILKAYYWLGYRQSTTSNFNQSTNIKAPECIKYLVKSRFICTRQNFNSPSVQGRIQVRFHSRSHTFFILSAICKKVISTLSTMGNQAWRPWFVFRKIKNGQILHKSYL